MSIKFFNYLILILDFKKRFKKQKNALSKTKQLGNKKGYVELFHDAALAIGGSQVAQYKKRDN